MMANPETRLHAAAVRYLRTVCPDCITLHISNGGKRSKETARLMKALGVLPGVFDLLLICPDGRHMWLEAKSSDGRLSQEQQWFRGELILRGVPYVVFKSLDDVLEFIKQHKIPNRIAEMYEPHLRRTQAA
jgi:hypothetical protein